MKTKVVKLYTFDELSDDAREKAREWWRECEAQDFGGHDELNEPIETVAKLLGITFKTHAVKLMGGGTRDESDIYWTLHVQGSGASFNGTYEYAKGSVKAIRAEFPKDTVLHAIAQDLATLQKAHGYKITALIKSNDRYGHTVDVELGLDSVTERSITDNEDESMREVFRNFCRWIYEYIDAEYTYRMEDENVDDAIRANEYTFLENGKRED